MALPRYPPQPGLKYSGPTAPGQLPPLYAYYYYPVVGFFPPPVQPWPLPKAPQRPISPKTEIELNTVLTSARSHMIHWLVTQDPAQAMNNPELGGLHAHALSPHILNQAATFPRCDNMVLKSNDFPWIITVRVPSNEFITVKQILGAIYGSLQEPLQPEEWDKLSGNLKMNAHHSRLARLPPQLNVPPDIVAIRRADTLAEKIVFMGIKRVGDPSNPSVWNVRLGYIPDRDQPRTG